MSFLESVAAGFGCGVARAALYYGGREVVFQFSWWRYARWRRRRPAPLMVVAPHYAEHSVAIGRDAVADYRHLRTVVGKDSTAE